MSVCRISVDVNVCPGRVRPSNGPRLLVCVFGSSLKDETEDVYASGWTLITVTITSLCCLFIAATSVSWLLSMVILPTMPRSVWRSMRTGKKRWGRFHSGWTGQRHHFPDAGTRGGGTGPIKNKDRLSTIPRPPLTTWSMRCDKLTNFFRFNKLFAKIVQKSTAAT